MTTITFKLPDTEARRLKARARAANTTVSEFIRRQISPAEKPAGITLVTCPKTGAPIFSPAPHLPPLTNESVRALLDTDFP